jgi:esterase/lipase superfamily enzyme
MLALTGTPGAAQERSPPDLQRIAEAMDRGDATTLAALSHDAVLLDELRRFDAETLIEFHLALATAYRDAGRTEEARAGFRTAIDLIREVRGADHLSRADPLAELAALTADPVVRYDLLNEAFAIRQSALGTGHALLLAYRVELDGARLALNEDRAARGQSPIAAPGPGVTPRRSQTRGAVPGVTAPAAPPQADPNFELVDVYWATHRAPTGRAAPAQAFGGDTAALSYGVAQVSVPRDREVGSLPRPSILSFEFRPDPRKHMILTRISPLSGRDSFFSTVTGVVSRSRRKEIFVFIHGYNTSFEAAALRTAQLAVDMNLDGAPILYSWPSRASLLAYGADTRVTADARILADVAAFLTDVAQTTGAERVHLVAHSMGGRVALRALDAIAARNRAGPPIFDEVVFAAADVGIDEFDTTWPRVVGMADRFTLYASRRDRALQVSAQINNMRRMGDAREIRVWNGLQTIDTTAASGGLLGHEDFAGSALADFRAIVWLSLAPDRRCVLQSTQATGGVFWTFGQGCPEDEFVSAAERVRRTGSYDSAIRDMDQDIATAPAEPRSLLRRARARVLSMFGAVAAPVAAGF